MRLTLRTLLAYLDDRLSSSNAREIGRKINGSPFAQELADRISTVVRQRRLAVPGRNVRTIDPNLIAEYLDDQLTPELVSRIEKEVLSSDYSLAEVAASHQILGLLADPVELNDRLRNRLLELSPKRSPEDTTDHELEEMTQPPDRRTADTDQDVWKPLAPQRSFSPKSPALIITVLIVAWLVLLLRPGSSWDTSSPATTASQTAEDGADKQFEGDRDPGVDTPDSDIVDTDSQPEEPQDTVDAAMDSVPAPPTELKDETPEVAQTDPEETQSAADIDVEQSSKQPVSVADAGQGEMSSEVTPDEPGAEPSGSAADPAPVDPEPSIRKQFQFAVSAPQSMLLTRSVSGGEWNLAASRQGDRPDWHDVVTNDLIAVSAPYRGTVTPLTAGWSATLLGPCLVQFSDGVAAGVQVFDGRCIIERDKLSADGEAATVDLIHGNVTTSCRLVGPGARLGVAVFALPPNITEGVQNVGNNPETLPLRNDIEVSVFVANGTASLQVGELEAMEIGNGRAARWYVRGAVPENLTVSDPSQLNAIPEWVYNGDEVPVAPVNSAAETLAAELLGTDSLVDTASELTSHRNALVAASAASILSVCRNVEALTAIMLATDEEAVRVEAISGLRQTAAQSVDAQNALLKELGNRLPSNSLDDAVQLLQGISPAEVEDEQVSQWLIGLLDHDRAAIRQMAIMALVELTGERYGYHPDNDRGRRRDSIGRWQKVLKRNNGRLIPPG